MPGEAFRRPVGAAADLRELEYVSALHQTGRTGVRPDGSISAEDVVKFLMSRYGIKVTQDFVSKTIFQGLGGGDDRIDLTEVVAMLLIPVLVRAARDYDDASLPCSSTEQEDDRNYECFCNDVDDRNDETMDAEGAAASSTADTKLSSMASSQNRPATGSVGTDSKDDSAPLSEAYADDRARNAPQQEQKHATKKGDEPMELASSSATRTGTRRSQYIRATAREKRELPRSEFKTDWEYSQYLKQRKIMQDLSLERSNEIISQVLWTILNDRRVGRGGGEGGPDPAPTVTGSKYKPPPLPLTVGLLETILVSYGEHELASDEKLLDEMVMAASPGTNVTEDGTSVPHMEEECITPTTAVTSTVSSIELEDCSDSVPSSTSAVLDRAAFLRGLTADVRLYNTDKVVELTTNYDDVFGRGYAAWDFRLRRGLDSGGFGCSRGGRNWWDCCPWKKDEVSTTELSREDDKDEEQVSMGDDARRTKISLKKVFTAEAIDYTCDSYRSKILVVILFVAFVFLYYGYFYGIDEHETLSCVDTEESIAFGCHVADAVVSWLLIGVNLFIFGVGFIGFGSLGNGVYSRKRSPVLLGTAITSILIFGSYIESWKWGQVDLTKRPDAEFRLLYYLILGAGIAIVSMQIFHVVELSVPERMLKGNGRLARLFTYPNVVSEAYGKRAALYKLNKMVTNAHNIHVREETRKFGSGSEDGSESSVPSLQKLPASPLSPESVALLNFARYGQEYENVTISWAWKELLSGRIFTLEGVWLSSRIVAANVAQLCATLIFVAVVIRTALRLVEVQREPDPIIPIPIPIIVTSVLVGVTCGLLTSCYLTLMYIPSYVCTTLKFRSGIIPSLNDQRFADYRYAQDTVTVILGSMFWGILFTAILITNIFGIFTFLVAWPVTQQLMLLGISQLLGLFIAIGIKIMVLQMMRFRYFSAFYRSQPYVTNLISLGLECWNLGLSSGYMLARCIRLLLATIIYIGRIDQPILVESAKVGPMYIDGYPMLFRKDILAHDAHRHPYMELLGVMYMMKLRHGTNFGRTSGSCWRLIFVHALFPWLRKYRLFSTEKMCDEESSSETKSNVMKNGIDRADNDCGSGGSGNASRGWERTSHSPDNEILRLRDKITSLELSLQSKDVAHLKETERFKSTISVLEAELDRMKALRGEKTKESEIENLTSSSGCRPLLNTW